MKKIEAEKYTLYLGDCLDILPTLEAGSIDAVVTDPPYGTTGSKWDVVIPFEPMWGALNYVIKDRSAVVFFGSQPFTSRLIISNLDWFRYEWIWDKKISGNFLLSKLQPLKIHENILVFSKAAHNYYPQMTIGRNRAKGGGKSNLWKMSDTRRSINNHYFPVSIQKFGNTNRNGQHLTQKPTHLLEYLTCTYTVLGETILDIAMGSGTTGVAALRTGRRFIGIEIDPDYFDIAHERIANAAGDYRLLGRERTSGQTAFNFMGE